MLPNLALLIEPSASGRSQILHTYSVWLVEREGNVALTTSIVAMTVYGSCTRVDPEIVGLSKCPCRVMSGAG